MKRRKHAMDVAHTEGLNMNRYLTIMLVMSAGLVLSGCPEDFSFASEYDCTGSYSGPWTSNEVEGYKIDCPLQLTLDQNMSAMWPSNYSVTGTAILDLTCFPIADALLGLLVGLDPIPVSGYLTPDGFLFLASPTLLESCQEGVCINLILEGNTSDNDGDGLVDNYEGGWIGTASVSGIPVPLAGEFDLSRQGQES